MIYKTGRRDCAPTSRYGARCDTEDTEVIPGIASEPAIQLIVPYVHFLTSLSPYYKGLQPEENFIDALLWDALIHS